MRKSLWMLALVFVFTTLGGTTARGDTVASYTGGSVLSVFADYYGQSFTTITVGPESNIAFSFFSNVPATTPYALGTGFLLSMAYTGTPSALSSATPGYLGQATASGGFYTFNPSLILDPGTQYFFYENAEIAAGDISGGLGYPGGHNYFSTGATVDFTTTGLATSNFQVTGVATPEPGTSTLTLTGLGLVGLLAAMRKRFALRHPLST